MREVAMVEVAIHGQWPLLLPEHRAARPEWPHWERERIQALNMALRPTDCLYEIGTEEGDMSALFARWCDRIHLFEPNPRVWPNVRAIWEANRLKPPAGCWSGFAGPRTAIPGAAWPDSHIWPASAWGPVIGDHGFCQLNERPDLPAVSLDDYAASTCDPPDVITMDVEGSELEVLRGAEGLLRDRRPVVFVSIHPESMLAHYRTYENELHKFMADLGYQGDFLAHDHETHYVFQHPSTARLRVSLEVWPL